MTHPDLCAMNKSHVDFDLLSADLADFSPGAAGLTVEEMHS